MEEIFVGFQFGARCPIGEVVHQFVHGGNVDMRRKRHDGFRRLVHDMRDVTFGLVLAEPQLVDTDAQPINGVCLGIVRAGEFQRFHALADALVAVIEDESGDLLVPTRLREPQRQVGREGEHHELSNHFMVVVFEVLDQLLLHLTDLAQPSGAPDLAQSAQRRHLFEQDFAVARRDILLADAILEELLHRHTMLTGLPKTVDKSNICVALQFGLVVFVQVASPRRLRNLCRQPTEFRVRLALGVEVATLHHASQRLRHRRNS